MINTEEVKDKSIGIAKYEIKDAAKKAINERIEEGVASYIIGISVFFEHQ
jgi:hypothetical protein